MHAIHSVKDDYEKNQHNNFSADAFFTRILYHTPVLGNAFELCQLYLKQHLYNCYLDNCYLNPLSIRTERGTFSNFDNKYSVVSQQPIGLPGRFMQFIKLWTIWLFACLDDEQQTNTNLGSISQLKI